MPGIIRSFQEKFPLVALTLEESFSNDLFARLRIERIDVAFVRTPPSDLAGLVVNSLLEEPMLVALPRGHALIRKFNRHAGLPLKSLADETFIVYGRESGPGLYDATIAACHAAGFDPHLGQEAPRIVSTLNLVATGLGISIVPESLQRMKVDGVIYRRLIGPIQPKAVLNLVSRRSEPSATVHQFLNMIKKAAEGLASRR